MNSKNDGTNAGAFDKLLILVAIIGVAVSILAVVVVINGGGGTTGDVGAVGEAETVQTTNFELTEFAITGDETAAPGPIRFEAHNSGAVIHNLVLEGGPTTPDLSNGESAVLDVGNLEPGTYTLFCSISGHREAGMETTFTVEEGGEASGGGDDAHGEDVDWEALDEAMTQSILAFPAETEGKGNEPLGCITPTTTDICKYPTGCLGSSSSGRRLCPADKRSPASRSLRTWKSPMRSR